MIWYHLHFEGWYHNTPSSHTASERSIVERYDTFISLIRPLWVPRNVYTPKTLLKTLAIWDNASLWRTFWIKGNNFGWIFPGLMRRSLTIGHNGSYMPMVANNVCSCAVVIYCSHNNKYAEVTWVEKSTKKLANNYGAKILGGCYAQLLVKAAITGRNVLGSATPKFGCDNMGVVLHIEHTPIDPFWKNRPNQMSYDTSKNWSRHHKFSAKCTTSMVTRANISSNCRGHMPSK